jgi:hypothetical protein
MHKPLDELARVAFDAVCSARSGKHPAHQTRFASPKRSPRPYDEKRPRQANPVKMDPLRLCLNFVTSGTCACENGAGARGCFACPSRCGRIFGGHDQPSASVRPSGRHRCSCSAHGHRTDKGRKAGGTACSAPAEVSLTSGESRLAQAGQNRSPCGIKVNASLWWPAPAWS